MKNASTRGMRKALLDRIRNIFVMKTIKKDKVVDNYIKKSKK